MVFANLLTAEKQGEEWQELQTVLESGILDKAPNLKHFLEYVAEQYFSGNTEQVKEYNIAVQALHRQEHFDPQSDTIVRVTAHTLRKKLDQYYAAEGASHPIQIRLPAGKYVLQFERREATPLPVADSGQSSPLSEPLVPVIPANMQSHRSFWISLAVIGAIGLLVLGGYFVHVRRPDLPARFESAASMAKAAANSVFTEPAGMPPDRIFRIRWGAASHPYMDSAGQSWISDQFCTGGSVFSHPNHNIQGTDDPALFEAGREGKFQCRIPVAPGSYQLLLLFADTAGDKEAVRQVDLSINNTVTAALDIVDEAGGDDIVVGKVYAGIHPMSDGTIHLDFTSDGSFVNAAEIAPSANDGGVPVRMRAGPAVFHDTDGSTWFPERFFQGGRRTFHADNLPRVPNPKLFEWERYGHIHYRIPVVAGKEYRVRLYFSEGWFGVSNGGPGGVGSRVFDVYCNGTTLLKDFDILRSQNDGAAVATFDHIKATDHGMLEIDLIPITNYPLINAIEIEPQS